MDKHMHYRSFQSSCRMKLLAVCFSAISFLAIKSVAAPTFETLHAFQLSTSAPSAPLSPQGKLLRANDGNFYGTTSHGGLGNWGTIFKMTPDGVFSILVNFTGPNGAAPLGGLVRGSDGNLYGTTSQGGAFQKGTVFMMNSHGALTTLVSFAGTNGKHPVGELTLGNDGEFYGVTSEGGSAGAIGTVFRMSPGGGLKTLASFKQTNGASPRAGLIQASDGNFYGTTSSGGGLGYGTVFRISQDGVVSTFSDLTGTNGGIPVSALIQARDGNLYGTTTEGGHSGYGTIFQLTLSRTLQTVYEFTDRNFSSPGSSLIEADDGNFYGSTTDPDNADSGGRIFQLTSHGHMEVVANFTATLGNTDREFSGLIQDNDGNLYGTTTVKGNSTTGESASGGQIFRLRLQPAATPEITVKSPDGTSLVNGLGNVSFGLVGTTSSRSLTFTIGNTGNADLTGLALRIDGPDAADFAITRSPVSPVHGPEGTTTFTVRFSPQATGAGNAKLHITSNDPDKSEFNVALKGSGVVLSPEISVSLPKHRELEDGVSKENFGNVKVGKTSRTRIFTIKNTGKANLTGLSLKKDGPDKSEFTLTNLSKKTLSPGKSTTFKVIFKPVAKGSRIAGIHIVSNDKDENPFDIKLSGSGIKP